MKNTNIFSSPLGWSDISAGGYRQYPAISNSDLSEFRDFIFAKKRFKPFKAFAFGNALHELLLEPHKPHFIPETVDKDLVLHLSNKVRENKFCNWVLQFSRKEQGFLFEDKNTQLPCKAKIDMVLKQNLIVDFKTTSQPNEAAFLKSCIEYEYDRQAAFYLDAVQTAKTPLFSRKKVESDRRKMKFIFVGIQKKAPYDIFIFDASAEKGFIPYGRKKYQSLLKTWQEMGGIDSGFTPSTWDKNLLKNVA